MKIKKSQSIGTLDVYDLEVGHEHHSFVHESHLIVHNSALIISNSPVHDFIPVFEISGVRCTSYTAESVESVGGIKYDYLVVKSLNDISIALNLIKQRSGIEVPDCIMLDNKQVPNCRLLAFKNNLYDIWNLPSDQEVFKDISTGKTETVFQFSTPGALKWLKCFNFEKENGNSGIDSIEQMAAFTALDRPGPLDIYIKDPEGRKINALQEYARRVKGLVPSNGFEAFIGLIPMTYDILIFQESVQTIYQYFTGCTGAEAEEFRSNVAKKKKEKIIKTYPIFIEKASKKVGKIKAEQVWEALNVFSAYGFNKSHAISYATIGYACAFLKHYYPLEWWTAVLKNASKDDIIEKFWKYCGHIIDLPDINTSGDNFEINGNRIQAPLTMLYGIGEAAHKQICDLRPFIDIKDFIQKNEEVKKTKRSSIHRGVVYKLIVTGVIDSLFPKDIPILEKLQIFENEMAEFHPKKKIEKIKTEYRNLTSLNVYQLCKDLLPVYAQPLLPLLADIKTPNIISFNTKEGIRYKYQGFRNHPLLINYLDIKAMENNDSALFENTTFAIAAYVSDTRIFSYGPQKEKQACALTLDIDGNIFEVVKWPARNTNKLPINFDVKQGEIVIVELNKYNNKYSVGDIVSVQKSFKLNSKENGEENV